MAESEKKIIEIDGGTTFSELVEKEACRADMRLCHKKESSQSQA